MRPLTEFAELECINLLSEPRRRDWETLFNLAQNYFEGSSVSLQLIAYTIHDCSHHCFNIYKNISKVLIPKTVWERPEKLRGITDEELFLLDVAVLFHDYAMKNILDDAYRGRHSEESAKMFKNMCKTQYAFQTIFDTVEKQNIIANIIMAHSDIKEFSTEKQEFKTVTATFEDVPMCSGSNVHTKVLAGILRVADELDVTQTRFPRNYAANITALKKYLPTAPPDIQAGLKESLDHWYKLEYFSSICRSDYEIKLDVVGEKYLSDINNGAEIIKKVINKITHELNYVERNCSPDFANLVGNKLQVEASFSQILTDEKSGISHRTKVFYKRVLPFLLNEYLLKTMPNIYNKLYIEQSSTYNKNVLPFIQLVKLSPTESLKLVKNTKNKRIFTANKQYTDIIAWKRALVDGDNFYNAPLYILDSITDNKLYLEQSDYYTSFGTSDVTFFNLVRFFPEKYFYTQPNMEDTVNQNYPQFLDAINHWKNQLCVVVQDNSFVFDSYHAGLGVSTLTVIKRDEEYMYPITKNSKQKATGGNDRIVIPAGAYQPCKWDDAHDMNPRLQVLREFGEELLGEKELRYRDIPSKSLYKVLQEKKCSSTLFSKLIAAVLEKRSGVTLIWTGVVFDILRMRPEITCLLIIDNLEYPKCSFEKSWESERIDWYNLFDDVAFSKLIGCQEEPLVPPGLAALIWGRDTALKAITKKTS
ncbi:MAG: hypothetical protein FWB84_05585 [Candidatus Bathyarchaeota archaeon]|uniref:HD domain-containing protein n=1 Tax=Candidatus Bathycorpusculum sp. TaxID=2994959 RepID=UPI00282E5D17|nr:hypothetical protein [Candidatus Termiticorpusculum sp.]